jgi:glycerol-3-phosphate acyltransferase PlsY
VLLNNFYWNTTLILLISYLIGSIPTAYIAGRIKGIDIRKVGNKNVGGSNVFFNLGKIAGIIVTLVDIGKGALVVWLAIYLSNDHPFIPMLAAVAAIAGHNWMIFIKFKGGKGTATLIGALLVLSPLSILFFLLLFLPVASVLLKDTYLGHGVAMFFFSFFLWYREGQYYWLIFMLLCTLVYSLRCLNLYITYFTEDRRFVNWIFRVLLKPFFRNVR